MSGLYLLFPMVSLSLMRFAYMAMILELKKNEDSGCIFSFHRQMNSHGGPQSKLVNEW